MLYLPLSDALGQRRTTNLADETLCLSTIFGMDSGAFLDIRGKEGESDGELAERRMVKFVQQIGTFNTGLIFGDYPRISREGYRRARDLCSVHECRLSAPLKTSEKGASKILDPTRD